MTLTTPAAADFPVLAQEGLTYLDSAATAQTARPVIEAMDEYYEAYRASIHRGVYPLAARSTEAYEGARDRVAAFAGSTPGETVFTRNATEAINLVAYSWGRANVGAGDLVVVTQMEHHSNLVPWQILCQEKGAELAYVPVTDDGLLDMQAFGDLLTRRPKLIAVAHVSNVLGTINPIAEIVERVEVQQALVGDRHVGQPRPEDLPRDDVRVVLHLRGDDEVVGTHVGAPPCVRDEVDRLGHVLGEDRLAGGRVREQRDPLARELVGVRRLRRDRVDPAVDGRAIRLVVAVHLLDRRTDGLRSGRSVEIHEALAREGRELRGGGDRERHYAAAATSSRIQP